MVWKSICDFGCYNGEAHVIFVHSFIFDLGKVIDNFTGWQLKNPNRQENKCIGRSLISKMKPILTELNQVRFYIKKSAENNYYKMRQLRVSCLCLLENLDKDFDQKFNFYLLNVIK